MSELLESLVSRFERETGRRPTIAVRAPGRVNLIGEHTDYCAGWVLPCAIDRDTFVVAAPREDGRYFVSSQEQPASIDFVAGEPVRLGDWGDYPRAVVAAFAEASIPLVGADLFIASEIPSGSGLSSSAALCVALVSVLGKLAGDGLPARRCAELAHRAENGFVGVPCGIMDPFVSAMGQAGNALRIDCRSQEVSLVRMSPSSGSILVAHSGVTRRLASGSYGNRRGECERALAMIRKDPDFSRVTTLRDVTPQDLPLLQPRLDSVLFRRVRHVVTENERVHTFAEALVAGDGAAAGDCLKAGMRSLQGDFEVSVPELDALCEIGDATPGVYGSRLTGAGFGGCSLHWVEPEHAAAAAIAIADGFEAAFGRRPPVHPMVAADGAAALPL